MGQSIIEKAAKLIGYKLVEHEGERVILLQGERSVLILEDGVTRDFNPYTNKADLMDVECALGIDVMWFDDEVFASKEDKEELTFSAKFSDHPNKFTARANAVMDVVSQIYDRREGK